MHAAMPLQGTGRPGRLAATLALALACFSAAPSAWAADAKPEPGTTAAPASTPPPAVIIGVDLSLTGRADVLGMQGRNAVRLWPTTLGGLPARYVILDDGSDPGRARANMAAFTGMPVGAGAGNSADTGTGTATPVGASTLASPSARTSTDGSSAGPARADAVVGFVTTPLAQDVMPDAARTRTPLVLLAGAGGLVEPMDADRAWVFKMSQNEDLMARALVDDMVRRGYRDIAFFGFDDTYGEGWRQAFIQAAANKVRIVAEERYPRTSQALVSQAQHIIAARPAAVLIAATGADAVLPQRTLRERGFGGQVYQTHGIATPDFLKEGDAEVEGTLFAAGPAMFARSLAPQHPARPAALAFADLYEGQYGKGTVTQFSADAYGAWVLLDHAVGQVARAGVRPGTEAFRDALRTALENTHLLAVPNGILNLSPTNHQGFGAEAALIGSVRNGKYTYSPD